MGGWGGGDSAMGIGIRNLEGPSGGKVGCEGWGPRSCYLPSTTRSYKQIGAGRTCANVRMRACLFSYANIVWDINFDAVHFPMHMRGCRSEKTLPDTHPCVRVLWWTRPTHDATAADKHMGKSFMGGERVSEWPRTLRPAQGNDDWDAGASDTNDTIHNA